MDNRTQPLGRVPLVPYSILISLHHTEWAIEHDHWDVFHWYHMPFWPYCITQNGQSNTTTGMCSIGTICHTDLIASHRMGNGTRPLGCVPLVPFWPYCITQNGQSNTTTGMCSIGTIFHSDLIASHRMGNQTRPPGCVPLVPYSILTLFQYFEFILFLKAAYPDRSATFFSFFYK